VDEDFQLPRGEEIEKLFAVVLELLAGLDVSEQGWPDDLDALEGNATGEMLGQMSMLSYRIEAKARV
jgi:hypothetical protein